MSEHEQAGDATSQETTETPAPDTQSADMPSADVGGDAGAPVAAEDGPEAAGPGPDADAGQDHAEPGPGAAEAGPDTLAVPVAELRPALEAVLMVADQPLDQVSLASAVGYPVEEVVAALHDLAEEYAAQGRGFDLRNVAGGWRYYTREEYAAVVEKFVLEGQQARLTQAALETLAVVAYKQPVSRARVSAVRGVNVDGVMRTLLARGLVEECGHDQETSATLYRTTSYFLERIGVTSIDELPELAPFLPEMDDLEELEESIAAPKAPAAAATSAAETSDEAPTEPHASQESE
ncbi:MAG: SMC-Scp complex subunit ScpB [Nocardioidaceae bacterium]